MTLGLPYFTYRAWKEGFCTVLRRIHYALIALAALFFIWLMNYWNLLGYRL